MLPRVYTYAHIHLVLLVRVHLCCLGSFVPNVWGADKGWCCFQSEAVGLTPSFSRVAVRRVTWVVSTISLVRLPLSQECFRFRVVMLVVSAQRGKWVGGVKSRQRDGSTSACLFGQCLGSGGSSEGGLFQWTSFSSGYRNAIDQADLWTG